MGLIDRGDEFTCSMCGQTLTANLTKEEALEEYREHFGDEEMAEEVVCDDCFEKMTTVMPTPGMEGEL